jgi:DNA gyrase subunit B
VGYEAPPSEVGRTEAHAEAKAARRTARELFVYIVEQGKKDYTVQRHKNLGEMSSAQL